MGWLQLRLLAVCGGEQQRLVAVRGAAADVGAWWWLG